MFKLHFYKEYWEDPIIKAILGMKNSFLTIVIDENNKTEPYSHEFWIYKGWDQKFTSLGNAMRKAHYKNKISFWNNE